MSSASVAGSASRRSVSSNSRSGRSGRSSAKLRPSASSSLMPLVSIATASRTTVTTSSVVASMVRTRWSGPTPKLTRTRSLVGSRKSRSGRHAAVHDALLARPLQHAVHFAQDRRDARVRERVAAGEQVGDARIVDVLANHRERVGPQPAPLDDRDEPAVAKTAQQFRVRREMVERVRLVALGRTDDFDQYAIGVLAPLAGGDLARRDQILRARPATELADDVEVAGEVREIGFADARRVRHGWLRSGRKGCQTELDARMMPWTIGPHRRPRPWNPAASCYAVPRSFRHDARHRCAVSSSE